MNAAFPGLGTVVNVVAVVLGATLGMMIGNRLPERTRSIVTDCLGLTTLLMALLSAWEVTSASLTDAVGSGAPMLIVLGSLLLGAILGSVLPEAHIAALTATGGLLLVAIALRLLRIREIPVGDLLPALVVAPLLTQLVVALR